MCPNRNNIVLSIPNNDKVNLSYNNNNNNNMHNRNKKNNNYIFKIFKPLIYRLSTLEDYIR